MDLVDPSKLANYLPLSIKLSDQARQKTEVAASELTVDWCHFGSDQLTAPFFTEDAHAQLQKPFNQLFRPFTDGNALLARAALPDCLEPSGLIFHMSRCGSTLLCQQLAQHDAHVVVSEAPAMDQLMQIRAHFAEPQWQSLFRACTLAIGSKRQPGWQKHWVKFDSWHTSEFTHIKRAFPNVPWIFLYRHPLDVLQSNLTIRASHSLPSLSKLPYALTMQEALAMPKEQFVALKIRETMEAALAIDDPTGLFINYQDLPEPGFGKILQHFGIQANDQQLSKMQAQAQFSAKTPGAIFKPDSDRKRAQASELTKACSEQLLMPMYEALEQRRWKPQ